jgi:hypothetical protein
MVHRMNRSEDADPAGVAEIVLEAWRAAERGIG